jgi:N-acetylglutamate synthase-like GNAT family acetyltransferase
MEKIIFMELKIDDVKIDFLNDFNRYQEIIEYYTKENGNWIIKKHGIVKVINWDKEYKDRRTTNLLNMLMKGGYAFGAYENGKLVGFATILNEKFGTKKQYVELKYFYVSFGNRNKGIGKELFRLCVEKAKEIKIEKMYISANSSVESQKFYLSMGCKDAMEMKEGYKNTKDERQMEYEIIKQKTCT